MMCTRPAGPNCVKLLLLVSALESQHGGVGEREEGKGGGKVRRLGRRKGRASCPWGMGGGSLPI